MEAFDKKRQADKPGLPMFVWIVASIICFVTALFYADNSDLGSAGVWLGATAINLSLCYLTWLVNKEG